MLSNALDNPNKKWYAFGNIVLNLNNVNKNWAQGQHFEISFWDLSNPGSEFVSLVNF